jgi:hypothetical protein
MNLNTDDLKTYKDEELKAAQKALSKELRHRKAEAKERANLEAAAKKFGFKLTPVEGGEKPAEIKPAAPFKM